MNGRTLTIAHHALERSWFSQSAKTPRIRRTFEDEFVVKLKAAGVDAAPSYRYIPEEGQTAEAQMLETVKQADADAAVITRFVRVEKKTDVTPGFYRPAPRCDFWLLSRIFRRLVGYYDPPTIHQSDIHISETNLYDLTENQLVWSGTVQTVDPSDINKEIKRYVDTVIEALKSKNLLPSK